MGFLLPPEPQTVWIGTGVRLLGAGTWITAPAPHCRWGSLRWLVPPDGTGTLNMPEILEVALQRCAAELSRRQGLCTTAPAPGETAPHAGEETGPQLVRQHASGARLRA